MPHAIDVFVLGERVDQMALAGSMHEAVSIRPIFLAPQTAAAFAASPAAARLIEGDAPFAAIVAGDSPRALDWSAAAALRLAKAAENDAARFCIRQIEPGMPGDPTAFDSSEAGQILLAARASHGPVVFRRSQLRRFGSLRAVEEPVWDWLIRAVLGGATVSAEPDWEEPGREIPGADVSRLPLLAPPSRGRESDWLKAHLAAAPPAPLGAAQASQRASQIAETAWRAGLLQWHDFLDESHRLSQSIEGEGEPRTGDYWHAIMHRREPDYSNAKYWFRRIGRPPAYGAVRRFADSVLAACRAPRAETWRARVQAGSQWNPLAFVDLCEECAADETSELAIAARRIQYAEMCLLV